MKYTASLACLALLFVSAAHADEEEAAVDEFEAYDPKPSDVNLAFFEGFQGETHSFVVSEADRYAGQSVTVGEGSKVPGIAGDNALVLDHPAKHYGLMAKFDAPMDNKDKDFVVQYEVRLHNGLECGGAYLKVLDAAKLPSGPDLTNESPYVIMFGPDKCGGTNKVHFIMRHQNPVSKEWEEKHAKNAPAVPIDDNSHLYTLVIRADNTFSVLIDSVEKSKGSLLKDMDPPVNPEKMIDDPEDSKPEDWVDEAKIKDPEASKPDDWDEDAPKQIVDEEAEMPDDWLEDEPLKVPDPEAEMPEDWDEEEDGEFEAPIVDNPKCEFISGCGKWEAPMIDNPDYKGKWSAPMIDNPDYKGVWAPRKIENPNFFTDEQPSNLAPMGAVAIEIWTMQKGIAFDNVYIGQDPEAAADFAEETFKVKVDKEKTAASDKAKAERKAEREKLLDGSVTGKAQYAFAEAIDWASDHPVVSGIAIVGVVFLLVFALSRCCGGEDDDDLQPRFESVPQPKRSNGAANGAANEDEDDKPEVEAKAAAPKEESADKPKEKKKTSLRKRKKKKAPKADD